MATPTDPADPLFARAMALVDCAPADRDFAAARAIAAEATPDRHPQAYRLHLNMVARGIGGPRDWPAALALLAALAETDPDSAEERALIGAMDLDAQGDPCHLPALAQRSFAPAIFTAPALFTDQECAWLVRRASPVSAPARVVDPFSGALVLDPVRRAHSASFNIVDETPALHALTRRLAAISRTDVDQGEPLQVLTYNPGDEYRPHLDNLQGSDNDRAITALVGLSGDYDGGQTQFPLVRLDFQLGLGDLLLFHNIRWGSADPLARHAGLPVTRGTKVIASRWIRQRRISPW